MRDWTDVVYCFHQVRGESRGPGSPINWCWAGSSTGPCAVCFAAVGRLAPVLRWLIENRQYEFDLLVLASDALLRQHLELIQRSASLAKLHARCAVEGSGEDRT